MDKREIDEVIKKEVRAQVKQSDIRPDAIKQRHVGEGIRFIRAGLAANLPTSGEMAGALYFETDTPALKVWDGSAWQTI